MSGRMLYTNVITLVNSRDWSSSVWLVFYRVREDEKVKKLPFLPCILYVF
jgi:hypothetical protein